MDNYSGKSYIKFWGVRGSNPTPDKDKMQFGGDTSCVEIRTENNELIILDMGTGLRNLGKKIIEDNTYPNEINIFLSHYHWDHIMGFFYFAPLYDSKFTINIHGYNAKTPMEDLSNALINKSFWPVDEEEYKAKINFIELDKTTNEPKLVKLNETAIYYSIHPHPNGANSFKIETNNKKIVYITDCEHPEGKLNPNVVRISNESDILIHDSHYTIRDLINHKGWGHSSWKQAVDVSITSNTKKLILFHYSPDYNDEQINEIEKNAQKKFVNTIASYQELLIEL
tara:strand:+ start:442 stop:1290 length:849 start_codon:yes stop_codon:yes gene_type:complete